jgi:MFS family permease
MGHYGDRLGRKSMLVWSLMLMGLSTLGIGLLPNYAQLGVWAPILLVTFRFVQGFALGGEWGGAVLMSVEHAPQSRRGFFGSFVALGLPAGIILSNLVFLVTSSAVSPRRSPDWAWRIPFIAAPCSWRLWIRMGLAEARSSPGAEGTVARRCRSSTCFRHARGPARGERGYRHQHAGLHRDRVAFVSRRASSSFR